MSAARAHDRLADLTATVKESERSLKAFARRLLSMRGALASVEDVEDVLSEAYLVAAGKLVEPGGPRIVNLRAWFFRIVYLTSLNHARRRDAAAWRQVATDVEREHTVLDALARLEDRIALREALAAVPDARDRQILSEASKGLTAEEIAEKLQMQPAAVRQAKRRAIQALRAALSLPEAES